MSESSIVDFIEEWQTGAFLVGCAVLSGLISALVLRALDLPYGRAIGFFGGAMQAFLGVSYALYGR